MLEEVCARMFMSSKSNNSDFQVARWFPTLASECLEDVPTTMDIIEGPVRYRRKKKWKSRWAVLRRVNPAADVINLVLYQDQVSARSRQKEKAFISLETFAGLQLLNKLDKHYNVIIAITANQVVRLSFETIEHRSEWVNCIQRHFGQEQSFDGIIPNKQKIKSGEATLRFYKDFFSLTRKDNYRLIGKWKLVDLPHYGAVYGAFAFEVKEGEGTCIYYFATKHGRELHQLFDNVCRGGDVNTENNYVEPPGLDHSTPQRSMSQQDSTVSQPNFFKRTWQRISKRRRTRQRPRSQSEPGENRRRKRGDNNSAHANRRLPAVPGSENNRARSVEPEVSSTSQDGKTGSVHMVTPDGYEIMTGNEEDAVDGKTERKRTMSRRSQTEEERPKSTAKESNPEDEKELDGYVVVDAVDVEEIIKEAEKRLKEKNEIEEQQQKSATKNEGVPDDEITMEPSYEKMEINLDEVPKQDNTPAKPTTTEIVKDESKEETEKKDGVKSNRDSDGYDNVSVPVTKSNEIKTNGNDNVVKKEERKPSKSPVRPKSLESKQELLVNSNRGRRGMRNPPPELVLPSPDSSDRPYVNSPPKTADYVNVPGRRGNGTSSAIRSRSKTANTKPGSKKINIYDIYDGNDDSIYHSVESLMPGNPTYQNLRAESNRSHSFDNIPGHSYTNLPGHCPDGQAYQNIGPPGTQAYVNVNAPKRKFQRNQNSHHLNYIQVEGTDGPSGQYGPPSFSVPAEQQNTAKNSGSEYTWIDESRTRLLKETARMHSDLRKENLPKITKKY